MIMVVTKTGDATADYVLEKMTKRQIPHIRFNSDEFSNDIIDLNFGSRNSNSVIVVGCRKIYLEEIKAVWFRRLIRPNVLGIANEEARQFAEQEFDFTMRWLIDSLNCPIIDREVDIMKARNKFAQLKLAEKIGFRIPDTLITNSPSKAHKFIEKYEAVAIKTIAGYGRRLNNGFETVYTQMLTPKIIQKFDSIRLAPICLQEYIEKKFELRITIVGERIFGCRIDSQQCPKARIDWRKGNAHLAHLEYAVDQDTASKLLKMMVHFRINFAAFDLIVTPKGEVVFLEMNPSGQFVWIEELTGMPISDALIDELIKPVKTS